MASGSKSAGQLRFDLSNASFKIKELSASIALKMMVMLFSRYLITSRGAGNFDNLQPLLGDESLNVSIDRRDAQLRMTAPSQLENLIRGQWPIALQKGLANCGLLLCIALFHGC